MEMDEEVDYKFGLTTLSGREEVDDAGFVRHYYTLNFDIATMITAYESLCAFDACFAGSQLRPWIDSQDIPLWTLSGYLSQSNLNLDWSDPSF